MKSSDLKVLRLILGDQLNEAHSWFKSLNDEVLYVMMELQPEATYTVHHIQKLVGFFASMRQFAEKLKAKGHQIIYFKLDFSQNLQSFEENIKQLIKQYEIKQFEYQLPDEYRLDQLLQTLTKNLANVEVKVFDTEHFLSTRSELAHFFKGKKLFLMESFYRYMRKKHQVLMEHDGQSPLTGKWNYDQENRKKLPAGQGITADWTSITDVSDLTEMIYQQQIPFIGNIDPVKFNWPLNREEALKLLDYFVKNKLKWFGTYQDAMTDKHPILFHSRISFAMNVKFIHPLEVIREVETYWRENQETVSIAQAEGFIRQVLGWREYMRGVYWAKMPDFAQMNFFEHKRPLPEWYWTGKTKMKCLQHSISQSLDHAYAHHIQRLMVTGNFALLLGVNPDEVDQWYLGIYMDAIEWVEITNTRGMSQFADGGIVGSKPYVSSANYIEKMSDYCGKCTYNQKKKYGEDACPFNSLFWDFYDRHRDKLMRHPRIGMMYRVWENMEAAEKERILKHAQWVKDHVETV